MRLIDPYIKSFLSQLRYSTTTEESKGIITFDEIKNELQRARVTTQMIDEYRAKIERLGIEAEVDKNAKAVYITINDVNKLILTPDQMMEKNKAVEHYLRNYE